MIGIFEITQLTERQKDNFWVKVKRLSEDECWEWTGGKLRFGYGRFRIGNSSHIAAHRISWFLTNGKIPENMLVCHKCDNPGCVNPNHLFIGTQKDNMQDCAVKGRTYDRIGSKNSNAKLKESDIPIIRERLNKGEAQASIAKRYKVGQMQISYIKNRINWAHVPQEI